LDISKAFDSVSWTFLLEIMKKMGFGQIWYDIISGLLATSSTQILLNGIPDWFIAHQKGLRQGGPLSPILFILIMDILSILVQWATEEGHLQPLAYRKLKHQIFIYADDVIFLKPDLTDINLVLDILRLFGKASGLQTNVQKSSVVPIRCDEQTLTSTKELLPCQFIDFPCKYLGLPLSINKLPTSQIQGIVDKVISMLPGWKVELMNRAGRTVHVHFMMMAKIIYMAMDVNLPQWAFKAIEKVHKGFLWRGRKEVRGVTTFRCGQRWLVPKSLVV
jgi:hypothetical protein